MNLLKLGGLWVSILAIAIAGIFQGCSDDDDDNPSPSNPTKTVWQLIQDDANLDSLEKYLLLDSVRNGASALINLINGADTAEYSMFAPDNDAFINLLMVDGFPDRIELINPDIIRGVLAYHIIPGDVPKGDLSSGDVLTSVQGESIGVNPDITLLTGAINQAIQIKRTSRGTNGSLNVVESVMIPPSIGATLTPILGTIAGDVLLGASFTTMAGIIYKADSDPSLGTPLTTILTVDTLTAFLVPNDVFASAGLDSSNFTPATARGTILGHLVDDIYTVDSLTNGRMLTSRSGAMITVANDGAGGITVVGSTAPAAALIPGLRDVPKKNGVYHVIAGIIQ